MEKQNVNNQICRACLESSDKLYPLIGKVINVDVNIATMLSYCISKELYLHEELPDGVCIPCFKIIRIAYNFVRQFKESEEKLIEQWCKQEVEEVNDSVCKTEVESGLIEETISIAESGDNLDTNETCLTQYDLETIHNYAGRHDDFICSKMEIETGLTEDTLNIAESLHTYDDNLDTNETSLTQYDLETIHNYAERYDSTDIVATQYEDVNLDTFKLQTDLSECETEECLSSLVEYVEDPNKVDDSCEDTSEVLGNPSLEVIKEFLIWDGLASGSVSAENKPLIMDIVQKGDGVSACEFTCPICDLTLKRLQKFNDHVVSHNTDTIICNKCPRPVELNIFQYIQHYKELHRYQCNICSKSLLSSYGFQYHMKQHEDIRKYVCPIKDCKKSFFLLHLLKKHMRTHSDTIKHICKLCGAKFRTYDTYRYHQKTHDGKRNHLCTECGRAFFQAVHLRDHMFRHTGYKRFTCDICGNSFTTNSQLKKHLKYCRKVK